MQKGGLILSAHFCPVAASLCGISAAITIFSQKPTDVGYQTITVAPGSTTGLAVQFEKVSGGNISIKDLVQSNNPKGAASIGGTADQIWTYDGFSWTKYYFYSARGVTKWLKTPVTNAATDAETTDEIGNGESFFFVRSSSGAAGNTVTLSGEVVPLSSTREISVAPGSTTAMAYPWPEGFKIKNFNNFNANPKGAASIGGTADQIWTYDGYSWTKYYFYSARGVTKWLKTPVTNAATDTETEDTIAAGQAFFFIRSSSGAAADKISFECN